MIEAYNKFAKDNHGAPHDKREKRITFNETMTITNMAYDRRRWKDNIVYRAIDKNRKYKNDE